jgi:hypothetical protein
MDATPKPPALPTLPALIARIEAGHPASDPLARLSDAVATGAAVTALADHLVGHFVDAARAAGASWAQIGVALGVSKQAVQQRFVPREPATVADFDLDVLRFSRFTDRCRRSVLDAGKIAVATGAADVTPMHLLIGLFAEPDSIAVRALADGGADPDLVRAAAVAALPAAPADGPVPSIAAEQTASIDALPFTPAARKVFDLAVRAALTLGHNYIGTEHLMLALAADPDSATARLLASFDLTRDGLGASVQRLLAELLANVRRKAAPVSPLDPAESGPGPAAG